MRRLRLRTATAEGQRGDVLVMFAVFAPVLILMMSFVLDTGNLLTLRRHLQLQADAGALAAAADFNNCSNATIDADVAKYSGFGGATYNPQVDGGLSSPSTILESINSKTYPGPVPGTPDDTNTAAPCTAQAVDVKLSDTNVPWYFRLFGPASINAHARVQLAEENTVGPGTPPFAISDPAPRSAAVCFVNESSGALIAQAPLVQNGTTWSNTATPAAVKVNVPGIAVRVALSGNASTSCTDAGATYVDSSGATVGILHIAGYTLGNAGTATAPVARSVTLTGAPTNSCDNGTGLYYFTDVAAACNLGITAQVDFGTATEPAGATVAAVVNGTSYALTYSGTSGTIETWKATSAYPSFPTGNGRNQINLSINSTAIKKAITITNVQSSYTAGGNSGPITAADVSQNGVSGANSLRECETGYTSCTYNLVVTLTIASLTPGPLQHLSVANGGVNCPGASNFTGSIEVGCQASYAIYTGGACNTTVQPYTCVTSKTGVKANDIAAGLNYRILGNEKASICNHPNNWNASNNGTVFPAGDPRILTLFITSYGSSGTEQIEAFATFYLTGWSGSGNGFANPCQPPPTSWNGTAGGDDVAANTTLVGHFINYVNAVGGGGGTSCVPTGLNQCVAVLTR